MKRERPAFVEVPSPFGPPISAIVANRNAITEVMLNKVPHVGLLLSVNAASAKIAVMTPAEAMKCARQLESAAIAVMAGRVGEPVIRRDITNVPEGQLYRIHADDYGTAMWMVTDLEGKRLEGLIEANAREGWIIREALDDQGAPIIDGDRYRHERIEMPVRIKRIATDG